MSLADPKDTEAWAGALRDALDVADALLWSRIQEGQWVTPEMARFAVSAHKRVEQAKAELTEIEDIQREHPISDPRRGREKAGNKPTLATDTP